MREKILVIEDQEDIRHLIALNLEALNYSINGYDNGTDGLASAIKNHYDLIILDVMLPGIDGLQICQTLRAKGIFTPILMLTARTTEACKVVGLEMGADDYLTKPFSVRELQARVKALLRRVAFNTRAKNEDAFEGLNINGLKINKQKRSVKLRDESINLTAKEFDLLIYLAKFPGQVFSRDELLNAVWGYHHAGYEHTVNSHINRLRSKLELNPAKPEFVLTVWGVGYKMHEQ